MSTRLRFGLWYDFRNPPAWKRPYDQLYGEIFDQIAWGEQNGFEDIWLSEHHFIDDGYSPSLLPIAAAIAARTKKIRIGTSVMLLPFHNPVRLAEDAATVDVISGGRFELGVGTGYKVEEFEGFATSSKERGGRTNEGLEIIRRLWEGETLTFKGRYFEVNKAKLTPEPIQKPRPPLWVGGFTPPALRRAAKYGDGYIGVSITKELYAQYLARTGESGKTDDECPARWRKVFPHCLERSGKDLERGGGPCHLPGECVCGVGQESRNAFVPTDSRPGASARRRVCSSWRTWRRVLRLIRECVEAAPLTHFYAWTLPPGLPASWIQPHLELFASKVIPAFR